VGSPCPRPPPRRVPRVPLERPSPLSLPSRSRARPGHTPLGHQSVSLPEGWTRLLFTVGRPPRRVGPARTSNTQGAGWYSNPTFCRARPTAKLLKISLSRSLFFDLYSWVPMYPIIKTFLTFPFPPFPTWLSEWVSVGRTPPPGGG